MATNLICSIPDCGKPVLVKARGLCSVHYQRLWRHGDPLEIKCSRNEAQNFYEKIVLSYDGYDCLVWPYARAKHGGYGKMSRGGKIGHVSRFLCEDIYGPPPTPEHEAAHSCGNGHFACVTKRHLSWKTSKGNHADKLIHDTHSRGERQWMSKLTEDDVRQILSLKGKEPQNSIAQRFGVARGTIGKIHRGEKWGWLSQSLFCSSQQAS